MSEKATSKRRNARENLLMYFYSCEFYPRGRSITREGLDRFSEFIDDIAFEDPVEAVREAVREVFDNVRITKLLPEDIIEFKVPFTEESVEMNFEEMDTENVNDGFLNLARRTVEKYPERASKKPTDSVIPVSGENGEFFIKYVKTYFSDLSEIDRHITENLENWDFSRISRMDKIILRMGITELKHFIDIPPKVIINEMIELGKKFSADKSNIFINGILNKMKDVLRTETTETKQENK